MFFFVHFPLLFSFSHFSKILIFHVFISFIFPCSDLMDVDAINVLASGKGKGSSSPRDGCFKCGGAHFQRDCNVHVTSRKGKGKKGEQGKSWSKSAGKGKSKDGNGKSKGSKGAKGSYNGDTSKTGLSSLEKSKSETSFTKDGVLTNGLIVGTQLAGTKVGNKPMTIPQARR